MGSFSLFVVLRRFLLKLPTTKTGRLFVPRLPGNLGGDLLHDLMSGGCLTEMQALRIFRQICSAVEYLHVTMKLVHRDSRFASNTLLLFFFFLFGFQKASD